MKVRDVMTYGVVSVPEGAAIAEAVETMLRSRSVAIRPNTRACSTHACARLMHLTSTSSLRWRRLTTVASGAPCSIACGAPQPGSGTRC